jgi:hypothetical protein
MNANRKQHWHVSLFFLASRDGLLSEEAKILLREELSTMLAEKWEKPCSQVLEKAHQCPQCGNGFAGGHHAVCE